MLVQRDLFRLALRRTLRPRSWILSALFFLWLCRGGEPLAEWSDVPAQLERGLVRQRIWAGAALWLSTFALYRACSTVGAWRRGEVDWLASRAVARGAVLRSTLLGQLAGLAVLLACAALGAEARLLGGGEPSLRLVGHLRGLEPALLQPGDARLFAIDDPAPRAGDGARVRASLTVVSGGGPGTDVAFAARRTEGGESTQTVRRLAGRGTIELELPPGAGPIALELRTRGDADALVALRSEDGLQLWAPAPTERLGSASMALQLALLLTAWVALGLGLGSWMSAPTAALLVAAAWGAAWWGDAGLGAWLPGAGLFGDLGVVADGRVPRAPTGGQVAGTAAAVLLGLGLAQLGTRVWRRAT